jgi:hypothetical protein
VRLRLLLVGLVLTGLLVAVPTASAKFRVTLALGKSSPAAGQPFTVSLRTDVELPADHDLLLVAVAPGRIRGNVLAAVTGASDLTTAVIPRDGFEIELHRVRADRWRGIARLPSKGRWQLVVPNWSDVGYAIPPPLVRFVVVR